MDDTAFARQITRDSWATEEVTADHVGRARRLMEIGLEVADIAQWLATSEATAKRVLAVTRAGYLWGLVTGAAGASLGAFTGMRKGSDMPEPEHEWASRLTVGYRCSRCWQICMDPESFDGPCIEDNEVEKSTLSPVE